MCLLIYILGMDFHWYRLDDNQFWSHKPGQTAATVYDSSGVVISDPRKADTSPYKFYSFMTTKRITIE